MRKLTALERRCIRDNCKEDQSYLDSLSIVHENGADNVYYTPGRGSFCVEEMEMLAAMTKDARRCLSCELMTKTVEKLLAEAEEARAESMRMYSNPLMALEASIEVLMPYAMGGVPS